MHLSFRAFVQGWGRTYPGGGLPATRGNWGGHAEWAIAYCLHSAAPFQAVAPECQAGSAASAPLVAQQRAGAGSVHTPRPPPGGYVAGSTRAEVGSRARHTPSPTSSPRQHQRWAQPGLSLWWPTRLLEPFSSSYRSCCLRSSMASLGDSGSATSATSAGRASSAASPSSACPLLASRKSRRSGVPCGRTVGVGGCDAGDGRHLF